MDWQQEEWRDISAFDDYQVSSHGRVRNKRSGRVKRVCIRGNGYPYAHFTVQGKQYLKSVHRLVAEAFIPNPEGKPCVNHIDGDKTNCHVSNLEWATYRENSQHAFATGLNKESVYKASAASMKRFHHQKSEAAQKGSRKRMRPVVRNDGIVFPSIKDAAIATGTSKGNIHATITGRYKHTKGFSFKYREDA